VIIVHNDKSNRRYVWSLAGSYRRDKAFLPLQITCPVAEGIDKFYIAAPFIQQFNFFQGQHPATNTVTPDRTNWIASGEPT